MRNTGYTAKTSNAVTCQERIYLGSLLMPNPGQPATSINIHIIQVEQKHHLDQVMVRTSLSSSPVYFLHIRRQTKEAKSNLIGARSLRSGS